jgi:quercetin dioxygenase-like cupin family protein
MASTELEKAKTHVSVEIIEYVPSSVVSKTILKKLTGSIVAMAFERGEGMLEKTSPFDTYAQITEGEAEIVIDGETFLLNTGQAIIIPAHKSNLIRANGRFKMIQTVIKSGYE